MGQVVDGGGLWLGVSVGHSSPVCHNAGLVRLTALLAVALSAAAQDQEDFRVYTDHPRLFLNAHRLRLLKRDRERESLRWTQFDSLVRGGVPLAEPGFALGLYHAISGDRATGERAVKWAATASDLRQLALVFDWCQDVLTDTTRQQLLSRMRSLPVRAGLAGVRDRVLTTIATAEEDKNGSEKALAGIVNGWWRTDTAPKLASGELVVAHADLYSLEEILHAIRDTVRIDLRENAGDYFKQLPIYELESYYPAPFQEGNSEFRVPPFTGGGDPDPRRAAMSRAAELSMVAYDTNARESQYVQGWLMQDRFLLRDSLGSPYEFLWGNPYQPGLSYMQLPLWYHDTVSGALFARSSWEEDATWFGLVGSEMQLFEKGRVGVLDHASAGPVELEAAQIVVGRARTAFLSSAETAFVVGLAPRRPYLVEADDEEMQELESDRRGTIELKFPKDRKVQVVVQEPR